MKAYKQKTETAKKDYLKQLAAYRANLISRSGHGHPHGGGGGELGVEFGGSLLGGASSPDSTTPGGAAEAAREAERAEVGEKSLASLIAEPAARHVLTATTTLTVPNAYPSVPPPASLLSSSGVEESGGPCQSRKSCQESEPAGYPEQGQWGEFAPNQGLLHHCR